MTPFKTKLAGLDRSHKRTIMIAYDSAAMLLAFWLAFCVRLGMWYWPRNPEVLLLWAGATMLGIAALLGVGVYRLIIRYLDLSTSARLALGAAGAAAAWFMVAFVARVPGMPRSVGFIYFGILFLLMFFGRLAASQFLLGPLRPQGLGRRKGDLKRSIGVAIYGANATGANLVDSIRRHPEYKVRFFVDGTAAMVGRMMQGYPVRPPGELRAAIESGQVQQVFLAIPDATRTERLAALAALSGLHVGVLTVPSYEEIMSGRYTVSDVRPVAVEDLLKRDIVPPLPHLIEGGIAGRSILVTGAGGSIGSEVCRQILSYGPSRLVLLDHSEFALYAIQQELIGLLAERDGAVTQIVPVIGSLLSERLVRGTLERHAIDTVFHAAAYKHVPLLEDNEVVGVENNVIGTKVLADACVAAEVARLTMISTDKAVRPANVMGSSKRVAELYIQALAGRAGTPTCFGIVRFGNVLDSSGSVVQQFRQQIAAGGPVTVTHEDITRFFMSIPEATQLVLQANALATGGEVFVLDMGEPVRIADLARTMIALSGKDERTPEHPEGDIEIVYIGLRPGEKLHEELFVGEDIEDSAHPQIKMARERSVPLDELQVTIRRLEEALKAHDGAGVRRILGRLLEMDQRLAA